MVYYSWNREKDYLAKLAKIKAFLLQHDGLECSLCNRKSQDEYFFELDHKKPVAIFGDTLKIRELQILCKWCHQTKTATDVVVCNTMRRLGIYWKNSQDGCYYSQYNEEERLKLYLDLSKLYTECHARKADPDKHCVHKQVDNNEQDIY